MNKAKAKQIARSGKITWGDLQATLRRAHEAGATDERRGVVNKGLTKAASYNIFVRYAKEHSSDDVVNKHIYSDWIGAQHIIREFGEFWEGWVPEERPKVEPPPPTHQPPVDCPF